MEAHPALNEISVAKKIEAILILCIGHISRIDIGSGDGELVLAAAKNGWRSTRIELNTKLWAISSFWQFHLPQEARMRRSLVLGNIWEYDILYHIQI